MNFTYINKMTGHSKQNEFFNLPDGIDRGELLRKLTSENSIVVEPPRKKREEFLDTFDRRLHAKDLALVKESGSLVLRDLNTGAVVEAYKIQKAPNPRFWWNLPKCGLRKALKGAISIRALLPLAKIERSITTLRLLNDDKKTVLFVYVKDLKTLDQPETNYSITLQIEPVRGYEDEALKFSEYLTSAGLTISRGDILSAIESNISKYPLDYSSKIKTRLEPDMKSLQAVKLLMKDLLQTMKANEFGIKEDIDTEFLHDFRVAVRRTRSALSQIKEVFPQDITDEFKIKFSEIGKATNELRDLDVYLLTEDSYKKMIPGELRDGLDPLFDLLTKKRSEAKNRCAEFLESDRYREIISSWEEFLDSDDSSYNEAKNAESPVIDIAKEFISKKYGKVIKLGNKITDSTPDPKLHELRIECKKLRYLLEFFTSLFPEDDMKTIIRHLKVLQDNLGDFNDLHVQQESLKNYLKSQNIGYDKSKANIHAASGGLISVLYQKQLRVRKKFSANFSEFSDRETAKLFEKLF